MRRLAAPHRYSPARGKGRYDAAFTTLALETLCHALPLGAVVLDAHCRPVFVNREGTALLQRWVRQRSVIKAQRWNVVPAEILAACERLRRGTIGQSPGKRPRFGGRVLVRHPRLPDISAVVALERSARDRRVALFCILLHDRLHENLVSGRKEQLALLTVAERHVAKLATDGLRNSEIAEKLGKSVTTVKSQLGAVFAKLQVRTRTQLAALLRGA